MTVTLENDGSTLMFTCSPDENSGICMIKLMWYFHCMEWFDVSSVQQAGLTYGTPAPILIAVLNLQ